MKILIIYDEVTGEIIIYKPDGCSPIPVFIEPRTEDRKKDDDESVH